MYCPDVGPGVKVSAGSSAKPVNVAACDSAAVYDSSRTNKQDSLLRLIVCNGLVGEQVIPKLVIHGRIASANPFQHHRGVLFFFVPVVRKDRS